MEEKKLSPQEEEVDLVNLFVILGRGIRNFFNAIFYFFSQVYHYLILLLIFFKKHTLKLGIALILGFIVGFILHKTEPETYVSKMLVESNFNSGVQLYKQIDYLNDLVKKKDTNSLADILNISSEVASNLKKFNVFAYQPDKSKYKAYDEYMQKTDTIYTKGFTFDDFKKRIKDSDLGFHQIEVESSLKKSFVDLTPGIIHLVENEYYKNRKKIEKGEILYKLGILNKNLVQIDSLRKLYKEVSLKEAEKPVATSTIEISQKEYKKEENDIKLFSISNDLLDQINTTNQELIRKNDVLNIISNFDQVGVPDKNITHKKYFQFAVLFFGLMLGWILLKGLNRYLENYRK
ncbi:MAG: hypothetical protein DSY82_03860 [Flavobacteriia bacterium]|nr:MAG: hypothetical protein DSY82_03860 [Flavobacteriia bacterium]